MAGTAARPDLLGPANSWRLASMLRRSLQERLMVLPDEVRVLRPTLVEAPIARPERETSWRPRSATSGRTTRWPGRPATTPSSSSRSTRARILPTSTGCAR